jgi:Peptidase family S41
MIKRLILVQFILIPLAIFSQECNCKDVFDWAKQTFEENDAGFSYIIDKKGEQAYAIHNQLIQEKVNKISDPKDCQNIIRDWLSFFRKSHVEFYYTEEIKSASNSKRHSQKSAEEEANKTNEEDTLYRKFLNSKHPFLESINERTLYLRIPSFSGKQKSKIDSLIALNRSRILSTENLIIDIRNGTGGSDASYSDLLPLIYTNPIRMPTVEFLSTELNNQRMYEIATNTGIALKFGLNSTQEEMKEYQADYDTLSNHLGEFVNLNSEKVQITSYDTVYKYPKNVGILINENNVSTDEQFLLEARQSKKVKLFGTTTRGGLDISNLYITYTPDEEFLLVYALSRSLRIPGLVIDDIGIMPDFYIDDEIPESMWIDHVAEILNQ